MFPGANSPAYTQAHLGQSEDDMPAHLGFKLSTSFFFDTRQGVAARRILRIMLYQYALGAFSSTGPVALCTRTHLPHPPPWPSHSSPSQLNCLPFCPRTTGRQLSHVTPRRCAAVKRGAEMHRQALTGAPSRRCSTRPSRWTSSCLAASSSASRQGLRILFFQLALRILEALRGITQVVPGTNGLNPIAGSPGDLNISRADMVPVQCAFAVSVATPHVHEVTVRFELPI